MVEPFSFSTYIGFTALSYFVKSGVKRLVGESSFGGPIEEVAGTLAKQGFSELVGNLPKILESPENHDLLRAVRRSYLNATLVMCYARLQNINPSKFDVKNLILQVVPNNEEPSKIVETLKNRLLSSDDEANKEIEWLVRAIKHLNDEIANTPNWKVAGTFEEATKKVELLLKPENADTQINDIQTKLKTELIAELASTASYQPFENNELVENNESDRKKRYGECLPPELFKSINQGWFLLKDDGSILRQTAAKIDFEWFDVLSVFFAEEIKTNPRVSTIFNATMLADLKYQNGQPCNFSPVDFAEHLAKANEIISASLENIKKEVGEINENVKLLLPLLTTIEGVQLILEEVRKANRGIVKIQTAQEESKEREEKTLHIVRQLQSKEQQGIPQTFVTLPNLKDKVYGRNQEIEILLEHLRTDDRHAAIIVPTCFGKTYLIKKFLYETLDENSVKAGHSNIFTKVIYLDCRLNQSLEMIASHFATLMGKTLEYRTGEEDSFLKQKIFTAIQNEKVLLIFDNFETWINDSSGLYANKEIAIFIKSFFSQHHNIRGIFVSQKTPTEDRDFSPKVTTLKEIGNSLLQGLSKDAALELVKKQAGKLKEQEINIGIDYVTDEALIKIFKKVYFVPQAIQSLVGFMENTNLTFADIDEEFWEDFKKDEYNETGLDDRLNDSLRPTRALLKRQVLSLDDFSKHILNLLAFLNVAAPKEILTLDFSNLSTNFLSQESAEASKALNKLRRSKLVQIEVDEAGEIDEQTRIARDIEYYSLHQFIRDVIRDVLPYFESKNEDNLEHFADIFWGKCDSAFERKLYGKQNALADCWMRLEEYLAEILGRSERKEKKGGAIFYKALALQQLREVNTAALSPEAKEQFLRDSESLYIKAIEINPNLGVVYSNLGNLLANDPDRWAEAEEKYNKAIEINPNYANAYSNLGVLLANDPNRLPEAEANYNKVIEINQNDADAYYNLARLNSLRHINEEAFKHLKIAVEMDSIFKSLAETDSDFDWIRDDEQFAEIIKG